MEPKPLFGNTSSQADNSGRGSEPRPLSFGSESPEAPVRNEPVRREPGALTFSAPEAEPSPIPAPVPASGTVPGALKFSSESASPKTPGALDFSSVAPSVTEQKPSGPKALTLPEGPAVPVSVAPRAAQALFAEDRHPAQGAAEDAARRLEPALLEAHDHKVRRLIAQLLPVTLSCLQDFAGSTLRAGPLLTQEVADLSTEFSKLDAAETLEDAVEACTLKTGFLDKLRARFANPQAIRPRLEALEKNLNGLSLKVQEALPRSADYAQGLILHLIALRAIEQVAGGPSSSSELQLLHQRLDLLRAATQQAQLIDAQLRQLQTLLVTLENKCEHILTVTLSAAALAKAGTRPA